jgi:hypothetical protein
VPRFAAGSAYARGSHAGSGNQHGARSDIALYGWLCHAGAEDQFPVWCQAGVIYGEAVVKRLGDKIAFLEGQLSNEDGSLIALASATASINQRT